MWGMFVIIISPMTPLCVFNHDGYHALDNDSLSNDLHSRQTSSSGSSSTSGSGSHVTALHYRTVNSDVAQPIDNIRSAGVCC